MNTLRTLHDAFTALEERADDYAAPERLARPRLAPPLAAAAGVLAVAAGVAAWQASRDGHPAGQPAAAGSTSASTSAAHPAERFRPPSTVAELTAKARSILAGTATITVDPRRSSGCGAAIGSAPTVPSATPTVPNATPTPTPPKPAGQPECSGAGIVGSLTSGGKTGGFDLDVYQAPPGEQPFCDLGTRCTTRTFADGSRLATSTWHDSEVSGGVTYEVNLVRPDGGEFLFHLSTEADPKGASVVTASHVPLTIAQMTAFVTSDRW
jgi:hypothetical protein